MQTKWVNRAILLIVVLNGLFLIVQLGFVNQSVTDGTFIRTAEGTNAWSKRGYEVAVIDDKQQPLQDGDIVLAIESYPVETIVDRLFCVSNNCSEANLPEVQAGATLTYTIERDGETMDVPVTFRPHPLLANHPAIAG